MTAFILAAIPVIAYLVFAFIALYTSLAMVRQIDDDHDFRSFFGAMFTITTPAFVVTYPILWFFVVAWRFYVMHMED